MSEVKRIPPLWVAAVIDTNLSAIEVRVALYILWRQGHNHSTWVKQDTIARELGLTVEGVRKIIGRLVEKGWISVIRPVHTALGVGLVYEVKHPNSGWGEHPNGDLGVHPNSHTANTPTAIPRHIRRTQSGTHTGKGRVVSDTSTFERFWTEYPKKVAKTEASEVWRDINPSEELAQKIILSVCAWKRSEQWTKEGGKYIVHPAKFLRERRFDDDLPCEPAPRPGDSDWLPSEAEVDAILAKTTQSAGENV